MENDPREIQPLERTQCAINFQGFPNHEPVPELGTSFETWKKLAAALEAEFPDPYRLLRAIANTNPPPVIVFLWRLEVQENGCIHGHVDRCENIRTLDYWRLDDALRRHCRSLTTRAFPKSPMIINEQSVRYLYATVNSPASIEGIARDIAAQLRLPDDPPDYRPAG